jgi:GMP synthase-like glutamine amidotransferase
MKPVAVVRSQQSCPLGALEEVFVEAAVPWHYVDAYDGHSLPGTSDVSGLIILGGAMNVDETATYPHLLPLRELVRNAVDTGLPTLGICLGAQVLARALGADVSKAPVKEVGFVNVQATIEGESDPVMSAFAPAAKVFQFHEDSIELPSGAELLYANDTNPVQAFRIGNAYGVQFHFEVTENEITNWSDDTPDLEESWGVTKDELLDQAKEHLAEQQRLGRDAARRFTLLLQ